MRKQALRRTLTRRELTCLWLISWLAAFTAHAQAPASLAGTAFMATVQDGGAPFADSGYFLLVPASSGNTFQIIKISAGFASSGTYTYSTLDGTGYVHLNDGSVGAISGELDYNDNVSGSYTFNTANGYQDGTFEMSSASAPASPAGLSLYCTLDDGNVPFASGGGSFTITFGASGSSYTIIGDEVTVFDSYGGCAYSNITKSAGQALVTDSRYGSCTAYFAFFDSSSGTFAFTQPSTGGFQIGEFTVVDDTPPTVAFTSPTNGMSVTTSNFTITGTAHDNVGVSDVYYLLNGAGTSVASTTNNWATWYADETLIPGTNVLQAYSVDTSENESAVKTVTFFYAQQTPLSVTIYGSGKGTTSITNGAALDVARTYTLTATPAPGCIFTGWTGDTNITNATFHFMMQPGLAFTADFEDAQKPTLSIATPTNGMTVTTPNFTIKGTARDNVGVGSVACVLNNQPQTSTTSNNWTNWNAAVTLTPGTNTITAFSSDTSGNNSLSHNVSFFYLLKTPLSVAVSGGKGKASLTNGTPLVIGRMQTITATAAPGFKFTGWTGTTNAATPTLHFMMESNFALVANFQDATPPTVSITSPTNSQTVTNFSVNVAGKAADNVGVTNVWFSTNNGVVWTSASTANNWTNWTAVAPLALGSNVIQAYSEDNTGLASAIKSVTVIRRPILTSFAIGGADGLTHPQAQIANDGLYCVAYQNHPVSPTNDNDDIGLLSPGPPPNAARVVSPLSPGDDPPAIAFGTTNYLMAAETFTPSGDYVEGAYFDNFSVGAVRPLTQSTNVAAFNTLVYGAGVFFLTWQDSANSSTNGGFDDIYGALVNPDGSVAVSDFQIASRGQQSEAGQGYAAFDGTNFLATWGGVSGGASVNGRIISPTGTFVTDPFTIYTNHSVAAGTTITAVVFDGTKYLVLYSAGLGSGASTNWHIGGRFVTTSGQVLTNQITITGDVGPQIVPCAAFDGEHYLVTWNQGFNPFAAFGTTAGGIKARLFDVDGHPVAPEFTLSNPASGQTALWATPIFGGNQFFCVVGLGHETSAAPKLKFSNGSLLGAFISQ